MSYDSEERYLGDGVYADWWNFKSDAEEEAEKQKKLKEENQAKMERARMRLEIRKQKAQEKIEKLQAEVQQKQVVGWGYIIMPIKI